jgi:esterase/lipase superfamily enzyme
MNISYHRWFSKNLNQDMEIKSYGTKGLSMLAFPTLGGRFFDFENFGMVASIESWINSESVVLYTIDSYDCQSWLDTSLQPAERASQHDKYVAYLTEEVVPFVQRQQESEEKMMLVGCDMGGYHASNFFFKRPDLFNGFISLSGFFDLQRFTEDFVDETIYYNSPLHYLPRLTDLWYLDLYRQSQIIICTGQGMWERQMVANAHALQRVLQEKDIPCKVDFWGYDADHNWSWWRKQFPYFLEFILSSQKDVSSIK